MAAAPVMIAMSAIQTGMSLYAQKQAQKAASNESKYRQQLLNRKAEAERFALKTNTSLRLEERRRTLAEVRASNAARGFAESGTQLAVFGEIGSRIDEQIDQATNQSLDQIASYREQIAMEKYQQKQRDAAGKLQMIGTVVSGATSAMQSGMQAKQTYGDRPFSIF